MSRILLLIREGKEHIPVIGISEYKGKDVLVCGPACVKVGQLGQGDSGSKLPALQPHFYFVPFLLTFTVRTCFLSLQHTKWSLMACVLAAVLCFFLLLAQMLPPQRAFPAHCN